MKKNIISIATGCLILLSGCQEPLEKESHEKQVALSEEFAKVDIQLENMLTKIEDPDYDFAMKAQLVCTDYPKIYKEEYMPLLLEQSSDLFDQKTLLSDLDFILDYYKKHYNIQC